MTVTGPGPATARAALTRLVAALEGHLSACTTRTGENDPAVQKAYDRLRAAAERYDDALFDAFDEVTPWEFVDEGGEGVEDLDRPRRVAVLVRRDYQVAAPERLVEAGRDAYAEASPDAPAGLAELDVPDIGRALHQLLYAYGVDGLDHRAEAAGLDARGGTVWVQVLPVDDDTLLEEPFRVADEELLVYRLDEVVEDGDDDLEGLADAEDDTDDEDIARR